MVQVSGWFGRGAALALSAVVAPTTALAQVAGDAAPAPEDTLRVSVGATYAEGRYGQPARSEIATVPVSVKYTRGRFSVKVTVPYVHIRGPGTLLDGTGSGASGSGNSGSGSGGSEVSEQEKETETGGTGTGGDAGSGSDNGEDDGTGAGMGTGTGGTAGVPPVPMRSRSGLGDTTVTLAYALPLSEQLSLESRGRIKVPTASTRKAIGTGQVDVTLAADLVGTFGPATVYAGGRRRFLGRSTRFPVRDGWGFGGGASYQIAAAFTVGADYDWLESATPGRSPISEASVWISARLSRKVRLQAYGGTGFSSRSADALGGLTLVWRP